MTEGTDRGTDPITQSVQVEPPREQDPQPSRAEPRQDQDLQPPQMEPLEQRQTRDRRRNGAVFTEDLFLELMEVGDDSSPQPDRPIRPMERSALEDLEDLFGSTYMTDGDEVASMVPQRIQEGSEGGAAAVEMVQAQVHFQANVQEDSAGESPETERSSTSRRNRQRPTRHVNSERKMIDWDLTVTKKWLIVGDSNVSRIPAYDIPDLQIDAYPGANFRHAQALMKKAISEVVVEKIVLAFGLNHRDQKARQTSVKQLQGAVRAAKEKFPYAEIWVPLLNFSSALSSVARQTLTTLNGHIGRNMSSLSKLDDDDFHTEGDNVHWTKDTAVAMLKHWATLLNLTAL